MQYLYCDEEMYYFMNKETFEQISLPLTSLKEATLYLSEGMSVKVSLYKEEPLAVELPPSVELEVSSTEPGFKGDTQSATTKPAKLTTGLSLQVPLFINPGDVIKVSTKSGEYLERVSAKS
jgi:elongation factor P